MTFKILAIRWYYRLISPIRRLYRFIVRPRTFGTKVLIEHDGKYLMIRNTYGKGHWTFSGGGKHRHETPEEGAKREAREEVGIQLDTLIYLGEYFSQVQYTQNTVYCFYARVGSDDFKIDPQEIAEARWFEPNQLPDLQSSSVGKVLNLLAQYQHTQH